MKSFIKICLFCLMPILSMAQKDPTWGYVNKQQADSLRRSLITEKNDTLKMAAFRSLGFYYQAFKRDSGLFFHEQQLALSTKLNMKLWQADSYSQAANVLNGLGNLMKSYEYFSKAIKLAGDEKNESDNWRPWTFSNSENSHDARISILAMNYMMMGLNLWRNVCELEKSRVSLQEGLKLGESINNGKIIYLSSRGLAIIMSPDSSLLFLKKSIEIATKAGYNRVGFSYVFIARIYLQKGMLDSALIYTHKSITKFGAEKELIALPFAYNTLSDIFLGQNNTDSSLYYSKKAIETDFLLGTPNEALVNAYKGISTVYSLKNNKDSAYKYESLAYQLNDSLKNAKIANLTEYQKFAFSEQLRLKKLEEEKTAYKNNIKMVGLISVLGVIVIVALILYRKDRQKQKANKVLETTLINLKSTQTQLIQSEKMASLGELTAGIAHEIQNPLNFVNNFSEVNKELIDEMQQELKAGKIDDALEISNDIKANEEKINLHGKRADAIVKGMLQHSRSSRGAAKEPTDINKLADEYLRLAYHGLRAKDKSFNATMQTDFDESIGNINIIPQDIGRVLLNLYNNAFYAVDEKLKAESLKPKAEGKAYEPTVLVSTKREGNKILISLKDNGNGIPQKVVEKIFQPFFTTKPTGQGTGLGLSLSYDIVKAHDGELQVKTKEGEGCKFIITLPLN
ncbi:sensor histidine kinase [Ferruginibacter sp.]|uniref:sensor histidine kinase n=2 Tax=Ferruginibacter sp. TaxID=1940288 RepID=UPI0026589E64|nr:ATP-binding protein [Ferruginibacter sp.]